MIFLSTIRVSATPVQEDYFPVRPAASTAVKMVAGTVLAYTATSAPMAEHLTIQDTQTKKPITFELDLKTNIDGKPFNCGVELACPRLPSGIVIGKTRVAVLFWDTDSALAGAKVLEIPGSGMHGTDYLITIP